MLNDRPLEETIPWRLWGQDWNRQIDELLRNLKVGDDLVRATWRIWDSTPDGDPNKARLWEQATRCERDLDVSRNVLDAIARDHEEDFAKACKVLDEICTEAEREGLIEPEEQPVAH